VKVFLCARPDHSIYLASYLADKKALGKYLTFYYPKNRLIDRVFAEKARKYLKKCSISSGFVKDKPNIFVIREFLKIMFQIYGKDTALKMAYYNSDKIFGKFALKNIEFKYDIFHCWSQYALESFQYICSSDKSFPRFLDIYSVWKPKANEIYEKYLGYKNYFYNKSISRVEKELELATDVIVPTKFVADSLPKKTYNLHIIPYGCDTGRFFPIKNHTRNLTNILQILYVGTISYEKGFDYLFKAIKQIRKEGKNICFTVVGKPSPSYKSEFSKIHKDFNYLGNIPNGNLNTIYNNADLLVMPSLCEGSSLVIAEALSAGLPVLVSDNSGSFVTDGYDGLIFNTGEVNDLLSKFNFIYKNKIWLKNARTNARISACHHSWNDYANEIFKIYSNYLNPR